MIPDIETYLVVFVGVLCLAVLGTPLARKLGLRWQIMDQPDATRKVHTVPTPRMGGIAIFLSTLAAAILLRGIFNELSGILVGATLVSFLGFWDDRYHLGAGIKLAGQLLAAGLLATNGCYRPGVPLSSPEPGSYRAVGGWHHQRYEPVGQYGWAVRRHCSDRRSALLYLVCAQRSVLGRRARRRRHGSVHRVSYLQLESSDHFHGRFRQPFPWLHVGLPWYQATVPGQRSLCDLDDPATGSGRADL